VQPTTFRETEHEAAKVSPAIQYVRSVGGGTVHYAANYWRFHPVDFKEATTYGNIPGAALADWPITYEELEPYYTKVDWEIGVSGEAGVSKFDPPRSKPYPMPPLPVESDGVLLEIGAKKLGWTAFPAPMAIASRPYRGRAACAGCGFCWGFGCEYGAKSSTLFTVIPEAVQTRRCEIRPDSYVRKVQTNGAGRVTGVVYFNREKKEVFQRAKTVVLCANGAETPRLLLMSASNRFPNGLANSSGMVGRHFMFNGATVGFGVFEHEVNAWKGATVTRIVHDTYELDPKLGLVGGGGFDFRMIGGPLYFALNVQEPGKRAWGADYKRLLQSYSRIVMCLGHTTQLPSASNTISLDPVVKDAWGLPALRVTFREHPNDVKLLDWFNDRALHLLDAAGALRSAKTPPDLGKFPAPHLLGTCRMGNDPRSSVIDKYHRAHDVPNLFIVDGSSLVTGGRGQPTMTIQALAFRAAEHMGRIARQG
jgi:choline dehydrogenase-like flavoprotein